EVVARLRARPRVVRNLVSRQAGRLAHLLSDQIKLPGKLAVGRAQGTRRVPRSEWGALFDGELIEREMIGGVLERAGEFLAPRARRLPLARIDQVEGDTVELALGEGKRAERFVGRVHPPERLEAPIVERLNAERETVDAGRAVAREVVRLDGCRIGFERDLGVLRQVPMRADR